MLSDFSAIRVACLGLLDSGGVDLSTVTTRQLCGTFSELFGIDACSEQLKTTVDAAIAQFFAAQMECGAVADKKSRKTTQRAPAGDLAPKKPGKAGQTEGAAKRPQAKKKSARKGTSATDAQLDRLKRYVVACGARKVWKRELADKSPPEASEHVKSILRELGVEGRPTLEKCKEVKRRHEHAQELSAIDPANIVPARLRATAPSAAKKAAGASTAGGGALNFSAYGDPDAE